MKHSLIRFLPLLFLVWISFGCSSTHRGTSSLPGKWLAEDESDSMQVYVNTDTLDIIAPKGLTLWYNEHLSGNYEISYSICMIMQEGEYDRLSDLNCFWAANDPLHPDNLFLRSKWRNGIFKNYNSLNLFYVGYGGNENTTTRFRRYYAQYYGVDDDKIKPLVREYTDESHLLSPNKWYHVVIRVEPNFRTTYSVNGEELFCAPLAQNEGNGYFALRLLQNHILLTAFKVKFIM